MRVNICGCLLVVALGCTVTAEIIHRVITEKETVLLSCPHPQTKVTWSRWTDGRKVDVFTVDGDREIRHNDPGRRYSSQADKSLHIQKAVASDSGTYWCNNERAAELTVIPSGTKILNATAGTSIALTCPVNVSEAEKLWRRKIGLKFTTVFGGNEMDEHAPGRARAQYSAETNTLTLTDLRPTDYGLYYCGENVASYLNITAAPQQHLVLVLEVLLPLLFVAFVILFITWIYRSNKRGTDGHLDNVYAEITDESVFEGGSTQHDLTYVTISEPAEAGKQTVVPVYSVINKPHHLSRNEEPTDATYFLLENVKAPAHSGQTSSP
ncbi:uncharacterized protein LOC113126963 isoform X2 [Mastacembelus armatus]|uniref:uncharacterized protein LOC113126963 isoform X2 n=1 Tax=Mastacembelus armatus TaxID=205130 RepID=UPI000E45C1ED|nr:uncharacterized protein LOC113126963 isoform X2 [Mastacembelus armatus]